MTLDIIIPHYKEPWSVCKYLLDSIAMQELVDWNNVRVLMVNDGDDCVFDERLTQELYPFQFNILVKAKEGVSAARNAGLDQSDADYVMFCDSDDGFLNNLALYLMFKEMEDGQPSMINPAFIEETMIGSDGLIVVHRNDATYIHGKCYKRSFLEENHIRFPHGKNLHEDLYFNSLAIALGKDDIREINNPLYLWRYNPNSVVRHEHDFLIKHYPALVDIWSDICAWMKDTGHEKEHQALVVKYVLSAFYTFQLGSAMAPRNAKYRREAEKAFAKWFKVIRKTFYSAGDKMISDFVKVIRKSAEENGLMFERIDLNSWLATLK